MSDVELQPTSWWGDFDFQRDQCKRWSIGPLTLIIRLLNSEWQIAYQRSDEFDFNHATWDVSDTDVLPEVLDTNSRYIFRDPVGLVSITPNLADRPIISRPMTSFNLAAGEEATLYVSSPLWIAIAAGVSPRKALEEVAIQRPSDTWFGPSTLEGELCYASNTNCRLSLEELPHRPHRAITPVFIRNQADTTLLVERLNLPVPFLSLYKTPNGQLWTPKVTLTREKDGDMAELTIDETAPDEVANSTLLSKPRKVAGKSVLIRAFNAVFS